MIGHEDIIFDRKRDSTMEARTEVHTYRLEKEHLEKILEDFAAIKYELLKTSEKREIYFQFQKIMNVKNMDFLTKVCTDRLVEVFDK
jgi:CRP-like cAMP-binding protein